jgi:hypothetical protein
MIMEDKTMGKVYNFVNNGLSEVMDYLNKAYEKGEIEGIVVGMKMNDETYTMLNSQTLTQLEAIGLMECIKMTNFYAEY